jgi:hypothetical protein
MVYWRLNRKKTLDVRKWMSGQHQTRRWPSPSCATLKAIVLVTLVKPRSNVWPVVEA